MSTQFAFYSSVASDSKLTDEQINKRVTRVEIEKSHFRVNRNSKAIFLFLVAENSTSLFDFRRQRRL